MRRELLMRRRRGTLLALLGGGLLVLAIGAVATAYFTSSGTAAASATVGTLDAPTGVTATGTPGSGTVGVSWTAHNAPNGGSVDGYYVQRFVGATPSPACGTSPTSL